jgi:hypothetical protein
MYAEQSKVVVLFRLGNYSHFLSVSSIRVAYLTLHIQNTVALCGIDVNFYIYLTRYPSAKAKSCKEEAFFVDAFGSNAIQKKGIEGMGTKRRAVMHRNETKGERV